MTQQSLTCSRASSFPRRRARLEPMSILASLEAAQLADVHEPQPVDAELLGRIHHRDYLNFLATAHQRWCELTGRRWHR